MNISKYKYDICIYIHIYICIYIYLCMYSHRKTTGLEGGVSAECLTRRSKLWMRGGKIFMNDEISVRNFNLVPQIFGGGGFCS